MKQIAIFALAFFLAGCIAPQERMSAQSDSTIVLNRALNHLVAGPQMNPYRRGRRLYILNASLPVSFTPEIKGMKVVLVSSKKELHAKPLMQFCRVKVADITVSGGTAKVVLYVALPNMGQSGVYVYTIENENNQWHVKNLTAAG